MPQLASAKPGQHSCHCRRAGLLQALRPPSPTRPSGCSNSSWLACFHLCRGRRRHGPPAWRSPAGGAAGAGSGGAAAAAVGSGGGGKSGTTAASASSGTVGRGGAGTSAGMSGTAGIGGRGGSRSSGGAAGLAAEAGRSGGGRSTRRDAAGRAAASVAAIASAAANAPGGSSQTDCAYVRVWLQSGGAVTMSRRLCKASSPEDSEFRWRVPSQQLCRQQCSAGRGSWENRGSRQVCGEPLVRGSHGEGAVRVKRLCHDRLRQK